MANTPTKFLFISPSFLLLTFLYLSLVHQNQISNIIITPITLLPPPPNPLINILNHPHHIHHNISSSTKIALNKEGKNINNNTNSNNNSNNNSNSNSNNNDISLEKIEDGLARARSAILEASRNRSYKSDGNETFIPRGSVYRNPYAFQQSHKEMIKRFKIWTYKEGERPMVHQGPMDSIYGIEGHFIQEMEDDMSSMTRFMASHPNEAHVFFLPFSAVKIRMSFYEPHIYDRGPFNKVVLDYVNLLAHKYPYFNRSNGADHFMLSCHDWAPEISLANPILFKNLIRALCNANTSEGFQPMKDVSIPEVNVPSTQLNQPSMGVRPSMRQILAFFAGTNHGNVRKILFKHWSKDSEIQVHEHLPKNKNYFQILGQSKFCLCPSGWEVASSRIVEAIRAECVPVIIKDNYSFPFSDVLDWSEFSIHIPVARIPEIKMMLKRVSTKKYVKLLQGVRSVKWHFTFNRPSKPFDLIHMVLHSIWLRRLNIRLLH